MRTANNRCHRVCVAIHKIDETSSLHSLCERVHVCIPIIHAHTQTHTHTYASMHTDVRDICLHRKEGFYFAELSQLWVYAYRPPTCRARKGSIGKMVGGKRFQDGPSECAAETEVHMREHEGGSWRGQRDGSRECSTSRPRDLTAVGRM